MARINLKKIIQRDKNTAAILKQLVSVVGEPITIQDEKGKYLLGDAPAESANFYPIKYIETIIGKVYGTVAAKPIVDLVQLLVNQEQEKKKLGTEVLDLYREVNLMYNFAQKLAETIDQASIAKLTLDETNNLIATDSGIVVLSQEEKKQIEIVAESGESITTVEDLDNADNVFRQLMDKEEGGIINDFQDAPVTNMSILYAPLSVKSRQLGMIFLVSKKGYQFTAADLKLLSTLSIQSAAAIESAQLYERNLKEAQKREKAIKVLHEAASRFVPNEFIKSLGYDQITEVTLGDCVEKKVTVFFSDIRGYTSLSENMSPAETFRFVNAFNNRMGPIISRNRGFINQYLGDGIMAIFPYCPSDAIKASIEMHKELQVYNIVRQQKNRQAIKIGIGLHTGPLIMGITGDKHRMDATTISDTVNTAARIESLTKYYGVNILMTESCLIELAANSKHDYFDEFLLRYLGKVQVKGKQQALKIHECFDGDLSESIYYKSQYQVDFKSALQNFHDQKFTYAVATLSQIVTKNPDDRTACLFFSKANQLMIQGADKNWTGVETMMVK